MMTSERGYPPALMSWSIWGLGAVLYLIGFYQRVAPAVMTTELMRAFDIDAAGLGNLSAFYFYSYVAMQTPTGIIADRWGPRRLLAAGALVAGVGSLIFGLASNMVWAGLGRLLIGGSVAVAFVGMLKLAAHWFAPRQFALASGLALCSGIVGAVFAGVPLRLMVAGIGWRPVMLVSAAVTLVVAVGIWWLVRDDPAERGYASHAHVPAGTAHNIGIIAGIRQVFRYRNTWLLCLIPGGIVGSVLTFSGLWGVPFLAAHYGFSQTRAAAYCSALLVAWAVGGPVLGGLSDRIGRRKPLYVAGCLAVALSWVVIIYVPALPPAVLAALLLIAGFASGSMIIGFAYIKESVPQSLAGTVSGICNMGVMSGPMILQPAVGWILDLTWKGQTIAGEKFYALASYRLGFSLMLAWAVLGCVLILFTRETGCRQRV
ncbi:MAG: MFS transporter [Deltaproteobacteria bacterium]|nr:MFS transporter [Candidatus Anaeroferrophillacea bacterium]